MGLDVYVGSLTRYYTRDWETVVQKYARENNLKFQFVGSQPPPASGLVQPREEALPIILKWQRELRDGLAEHLNEALDWTEAEETPYFTDKPAWDCYGSLLCLAAHQDHPELPLPAKAVADFHKDTAFTASTAADFTSKYSHLLLPEMWLPYEAKFTFKVELGGKEMVVGSTSKLLDELWALNELTYSGTNDQFKEWLFEGSPKDAPFAVASRFALAIMIRLTEAAVKHKLPMKLDY